MKAFSIYTCTALLAASTLTASAGEAENKALAERIQRDARTKADSDRRAQAEKYRDKTHDNRLKTGPNSSLGGGVSGGGLFLDWKVRH